MNYTETYHLPQWEESDRVMRTDFNQMCADIEAGLCANAQGVSEAKTEAAKLPYVVGGYVGKAEAQDIYLGFRPSALFVFCTPNSNTETGTLCLSFSITKDSATPKVVLTDSGFHLISDDRKYRFPDTNRQGASYQFVAFR